MKRLISMVALVAALAFTATALAGSSSTPVKASVVYNSIIPNGPPANLPSDGPEAYAFNEFGNEITLAGTARHLNSVTVTLSSWACVSGSWIAGDCSTPSGATFSQPITLNIYNPSQDDGLTAGSLITSATQTFSVPYRPSASPKCGDGRWYSSGTKTCFNGLADNVTFNFSGVTIPNTVVYGIVYNTSHYGPSPIGTAACSSTSGGCPYDSLNIALSTDADVSAGSSTSGTVWQNSPYGGTPPLTPPGYCDGGAAGTDTFRADSSCWAPYVPAVQFKAGS